MSRKLLCLMCFVVLLGLTGNAAAQLDPAAITDGHVYLLDNVGADVPDDSANDNAGVLMGEPNVVDGLRGKALEFDGVDDGVHVPDSQYINITNGPWQNRTVMAVFKAANVDTPDPQVVYQEGGGVRGFNIYVQGGLVYVGGWNLAEYDWDPGSWISAPINSDEWHSVALVLRDGTDAEEPDKFEMWMDGELIGKAIGGQIYNHSGDNSIGYSKGGTVVHNASPGGDALYFEGTVDEVWILNEALSEAGIKVLMGLPVGEPLFLEPADGTEILESTAMLSWRNSDLATEHNVYMGTDADAVAAGTVPAVAATTNSILAGSAGGPIPDGLAPGSTYYWRVEGVNPDDPNSPWTSEVMSIFLRPELASEPSPADGTINLSPAAADFDWKSGFGAIMQTVAVGTDPDALVHGPPLVGDMPFDPPALEMDTTYYWQVNTFDGVTWKDGTVWSFSTLPTKVADITDPNLMGWWTFEEGPLSASALDQSGNERHGTLMGNATLTTDDVMGGVLSLDGSGGTYVNIDGYKGISADANEVQHPFTVTNWFKTTGNGEMVTWGSSPGRQRLSWRIDGGRLRTEHGSGNLRGNTYVNDGEWHHGALVVTEGASLRVPQTLLYVDTYPDSTFSGNDNTYNLGSDSDVSIGRRATSNDRWFPGMIDDVRIYDKALSREEIHDLFADPSIAWFPSPDRGASGDIWSITELSWRAGEGAVEHDVYLGTDADAVAAADTSDASGIYEGRVAETTFALGVPDLGKTYYWRIDEVAEDGSISMGQIWSFSTDDELVIFDEETPLDYDNTVDPFISTVELDLDPAQNWTDPIGRVAVNYTGNPAPGSVTVDDAAGTVTVVGRGDDIWNEADQFQYAYTTLTGDGSMTVKVESLDYTDPWTKAGIMIRETLDAGSSFAGVFATGENGVRFQGRAMANEAATSDTSVATDEQKALTPPVWIKIERMFPMVNAYYSTDGVNFVPMSWNPQVIPMSPAPIHIGLAVTSHSGDSTFATAVFSEITSDGGVAPGPLTSVEIGDMVSNSAEPMYMVLEDASGASAAVMNPDPAATQQTSATDFVVELAGLNIDLTSVTKATLVVGNLDAPVPGGTGSITINNVRLLPPLPLVVWVSDFYDDNGDGVSDDLPWVEWLEAEGFKVDYTPGASPGDGYWRTLDDAKIAALNDADLIVVSRNSNSGDYDDGDEPTQWNAITTPLILSSTHIVRSSRWKWLDTTSITNLTATMEVLVDDPIFEGVGVAGGIVDAQAAAVGPISFINTLDPGSGTVLAKTADADASWIIAWDAGVEFYAGSGEIAGGPRMFFGAGTQEGDGIGRGELNLTADGQAIFLNAVNELIGD